MYNYILKKVFYSILVIYGVITIVFFLFHVLPGDPARMMLDKREDSKQLELIKAKYGFDKPLHLQYFYYLNDVSILSFHNTKDVNSFAFLDYKKYNAKILFNYKDFSLVFKTPYLRTSFVKSNLKVSSIIKSTFPNTFLLALLAIIFALVFGLVFGVVSALNKNNIIDRIVLYLSVMGMALPSFFSAILIAWIFGYILHSYTGLSMTGSLYEIDDYGIGRSLNLKNIILPAITLGIRPLSVVIQLCRNSLLDVLSMDYIRTAKAKGLSRFLIVFKHALRNSLNPVITAVSGWFASLLAGAVFVEYIFAWNGLGKEIVDALNNMDLPVVMGSVVFISLIFVIINILVDLIYAWVDPRVRIE
ncbi:ABC transporter permease [Flavobacteriales bacterium]|nr:ABC transporter permease [Flavobacteriales bacterium]